MKAAPWTAWEPFSSSCSQLYLPGSSGPAPALPVHSYDERKPLGLPVGSDASRAVRMRGGAGAQPSSVQVATWWAGPGQNVPAHRVSPGRAGAGAGLALSAQGLQLNKDKTGDHTHGHSAALGSATASTLASPTQIQPPAKVGLSLLCSGGARLMPERVASFRTCPGNHHRPGHPQGQGCLAAAACSAMEQALGKGLKPRQVWASLFQLWKGRKACSLPGSVQPHRDPAL